MRRPTGFTNDTSYVALDVDVWCPDVVAVSVCVGVLLFFLFFVCLFFCCFFFLGGGGVCVSRDAFELH